VAEAIHTAAAASGDGPLADDLPLEQTLDHYLSPEHLAHPERGCVIAALGGEGARQPDPVRSAFAAAARGLLVAIERKLHPRQPHQATVLAPFETLEGVTTAVPRIVDSGLNPLILEYIDIMTMSATHTYTGLELGIPQEIKDTALAYLVVSMENISTDRLDEDTQAIAELLAELGAVDVYVLPAAAAAQLIDAREKAFWMAKANGANDVIDVVVPRAQIPEFMEKVSALANEYEAWIAGCGHAGDGNVHLGIFQGDDAKREALLHDLFEVGMSLGGAISAEHGIGQAKKKYFNDLEDPGKIALMRRIKSAFDPNGILNPDVLFD
jgi:glycolate oxidase